LAAPDGTAPDGTDLGAALRRNVYGTVAPEPACVAALAAYMQAQAGQLAAQGLRALASGTVAFGDPPTA
ncbi:MAG: ubiquinol-cytochrome C chaperone family protein, partial [Kiloniellaceae bacterium]